jgi:hypothetical protein
MADALTVPAQPTAARRHTVDRVFRGALVFNAALTLFWLFHVATGRPTRFFKDYRFDPTSLAQIVFGFFFFNVLWGLVWWGVKTLLLANVVGFSKDERRQAFSTRLDGRFDLPDLTSRYSERRIRIVDMIGRRGRFITLGLAGFFHLYAHLGAEPTPGFASAFLKDNLLDAVVGSWLFLALYYVNGFLGAAAYGPQSRVMDGVLARANCLLITTLWAAFKFALVPIGTQLAALYPAREFAPVFALIWGAYIVGDTASEVVGSLFGKQKLRVWGMGDVNRKSVAGTVGCFVATLAFCLWIVSSNGLPATWIVLAVLIALSNTALELFSPRGTDDFTMTVGNALLCWAFGAWLY